MFQFDHLTNLINGHYKVAEKYIHSLKRTLHYRSLAEKFEEMLHHPALIESDPELGAKMRIQPENDFYIALVDPRTNITSLLQANLHNRRAFEYKMAWMLLEKNVLGVVNEIKGMKEIGYEQLPRHIEEAVFVYVNLNRGELPDLGGFTVRPETEMRYRYYAAAFQRYRGGGSVAATEMYKIGGNTLWYYLQFK